MISTTRRTSTTVVESSDDSRIDNVSSLVAHVVVPSVSVSALHNLGTYARTHDRRNRNPHPPSYCKAVSNNDEPAALLDDYCQQILTIFVPSEDLLGIGACWFGGITTRVGERRRSSIDAGAVYKLRLRLQRRWRRRRVSDMPRCACACTRWNHSRGIATHPRRRWHHSWRSTHDRHALPHSNTTRQQRCRCPSRFSNPFERRLTLKRAAVQQLTRHQIRTISRYSQ